MALDGSELLLVQGVAADGSPAATTLQTTTGAIAQLAADTVEPPITNTAITTVGAGTLTAAAIVGGLITRSGSVAAFSDATDTAVNIVAALTAYVAGESFILRIKNTTAFLQTITAGVGVTLTGNAIVPGNYCAEYLVTIDSTTAVTVLYVSSEPLSDSTTGGITVAAGTAAAPGLALTGDTDLGLYRVSANVLAAVVGSSVEALRLGAAEVVVNEGSVDMDFRVESNGNANAIFVDGGNDKVGILNATPSATLDVTGSIASSTTIAAGTALSSGTTSAAGTYFLGSVGNALTAAGTTRADALQLAKEINHITTAGANTGVILPVGVVGMRVTIFNDGANPAQVYAAASETIDGVAGSTGVPLTNAKRADFFFVAANTWLSAQLGVVSA